MTADEAYALGVAHARPLSQDAADRIAAILLTRRAQPAQPEPQAA